MEKKILGLDLGVTSIGWSLITENDDLKYSIVDMGCRIVPLSTDDKDEFTKGNAISKNQKRTARRTQRKGYSRYKLRRYALSELLKEKGMMPDEHLMKLSSLELYGLRAKALKEKITLKELGRILYHLNQKRGYKSSKSDANQDKKDTEYVAEVKDRHNFLKTNNLSIGQYFFNELSKDKYYKIKKQVFPREAYIEEFDAICKTQKERHKEVLTDELIDRLRNDIIYFQRKLKSQKGLVSICELEGTIIRDELTGKEIFAGPRVAPKTSPLFQLCKIWEMVNNISLKVKNPEGSKYKWGDYIPTLEQKKKIADHLNTHAKLTYAELIKILGLKEENVYANKQIQKGLQGNITYSAIVAIIKNEKLLQFALSINIQNETTRLVDKKTGEILAETTKQVVDKSMEKEPLYQLWHTIYSINDLDECKEALIKRFALAPDEAEEMAKLDFKKQSFGEKSNKAIRKILPYLMLGYNYAHACTLAGYNHSNSITNEEKENLQTEHQLALLPKNSLRQPVVEKILNQMINLVNALIAKYGKPDEIRVELARELKQSQEERNAADKNIAFNKKINEEISRRLAEYHLPSTKRNIQKYKLLFPTKDKKWNESKVQNQCIYCGETFNLSDAITGANFDVDHIIPKALLFDDSQTNKVLVHRHCNANKTNSTAYDYISSKGEQELALYLNRVDDWFKNGIISYAKMQRLKVSHIEYLDRKKKKKETEADKKIWENFIERQLRETAYIARKARQLLKRICVNVHSTEGSITAELRKLWGWEDVLLQMQLEKYKAAEQTTIKEWTSDYGQRTHQKEEIKEWTKRDDHRHHAIDALVVACTRQGFIQRINTLNASEVRDEMKKEVDKQNSVYHERLTLLQRYLADKKPFTTEQVANAVANILISFKSGKRVATISKLNAKGKNAIKGVITPRGALSEESVYGKIKITEAQKTIKYLFENPQLIFFPHIKTKVEERIALYNGDPKKALASLKKEPLYLDDAKTQMLEYATCFKEEVVIKYPIESLKAKDTQFIIDKRIKEIVEARLQQFGNKEKEAFKDLENNPLWLNEEKKIKIHSVRCFTGLAAVEAVKKDSNGRNIGFVKPGNNHHIAIYTNKQGNKMEHVCSFWHAVERKKYGIPAVISNPHAVWDKILLDKENYPQSFLDKLPQDGWCFQLSMQQNEMFLLGLSTIEAEQAIHLNNRALISKHLYRVQKLTSKNYYFRHHLETELIDTDAAKLVKRYYSVRSIGSLDALNPYKVNINNIGEILKSL